MEKKLLSYGRGEPYLAPSCCLVPLPVGRCLITDFSGDLEDGLEEETAPIFYSTPQN